MCMTRLNPNTILCMLKLAIEEEKEIKKDGVQKEEELETKQKIVVENNLEEEDGWIVPSKRFQQQHSFPSVLTDINDITN